ncbi:alpha/beta hydrolase family protein [Paraburkholderia dipogonis]|uniref:alpha/beta hydrolase family protein n=1 Tax=Paraburkholderia dipogonis TaxID=1211383 RepID=UPI0035E9E287
MNEAVGQFAARVQGQRINLVGYSGGGASAVLIAARRTEVASIRTVVGNLDDEFVNRLHDVSSMPQSENAIDFANRMASIPQVHFSGADDTVVPPVVAQRFVDAAGARCAQARTVHDVSHDGDSSRRWPALLGVIPVCVGPSRINQENQANRISAEASSQGTCCSSLGAARRSADRHSSASRANYVVRRSRYAIHSGRPCAVFTVDRTTVGDDVAGAGYASFELGRDCVAMSRQQSGARTRATMELTCTPLDIGLAPTIFWSSNEPGATARTPALAFIPMGNWCGSVP